MAADVVKDDDCRRLVNETINYCGRVDHLLNTASLGHILLSRSRRHLCFSPFVAFDINFWENVYPWLFHKLVTSAANELIRCENIQIKGTFVFMHIPLIYKSGLADAKSSAPNYIYT
ncbi:hypothetical protein OIU85_003978 [Salix viminalis]|uniref:Uncharacterized protein n=1 Tax=Salix viminalis TaxID=40686 RepID=A0A9Q0SXK5_SALVM|nr:hypothetical protein OIU85_003978 [Salix viminalis]